MDLCRQLASVAAVVGLLSLALWWIKRRGLTTVSSGFKLARARRDLEILDRVFLSQQHSIHLVRFKDSQLLVAIHPAGISVILGPKLESQESCPQ